MGGPIDASNLGLIALAVLCVLLLIYPELLTRIHSIQAGGISFDLLETKQKEQAAQLDEFKLILSILIPENERRHILNLALGHTEKYVGNNNVRTELRRLRSINLIRSVQPVGNIKDDVQFDLSKFVELTDLGRKWIPQLLKYEREVTEAEPAHP